MPGHSWTDLTDTIPVCHSSRYTTASTVLRRDDTALLVDPAWTPAELAALATDLASWQLRVTAGWRTVVTWTRYWSARIRRSSGEPSRAGHGTGPHRHHGDGALTSAGISAGLKLEFSANGRAQRTSTIASTSTGAPSGSSATPTADRA
ncbi:MAG: hypothetical protein M3Y77_11360 [Actinomycetota bacterium]|nr:hypothetical protein [Actinomycetota bacterium]